MPGWANGFRHYRLQVEGSFERFFLSADRRTWLVQRRGGEILELGAPLTRPDLTGPALDSEPGRGPYRWNIARQHDLHGTRNLIVYHWQGLAPQRQHLRDIFYTPPASGGGGVQTDAFAYHVALSWEVPPNSETHYTHADKRRHELRLRRVAVSSKNWLGSGPRELVRAYNLTYYPARSVPNAIGEAPLWGRSSLKSIQVEGQCATPISESGGALPDPTSCASLPPMTFDYQAAQLASGVAVRTTLNGPSANGPLEYVTSTALVDINRDGLADLVQAWPANMRRPSYKFEYNVCRDGDFIIDAGDDPSTHDPQLACRPDDQYESTFDIRPARQHDAWINRKTTSAVAGFDHRCLDAGGVETSALTYYQVSGPHGYGSREPSVFTQYGAEAMGDWGNSAMLWSLAGYSGFGFAPALMNIPDGPTYEEGYDPLTFLKFCPAALSAPTYPALRWKKMGSAAWAKDAPGRGTPEYRNYTIVDIDGDGYADVLTDTISPAQDNVFQRAAIRFSRKIAELEGTVDQPGPGLYPFATLGGEAVTVTAAAGYSTYADIDGDGIVDLVTASDWIDGGTPQVRPGDGRGGFGCDPATDIGCSVPGNGSWLGSARRLSSPDTTKPWPIGLDFTYGFSKIGHFFHDVTADGLDDIVAYSPPPTPMGPNSVGRIQLWVNVGRGQFRCANGTDCVVGTIVDEEQPGSYRGGGAGHRVVFADIDGNGTEDFVLVGSKGLWSFSFLVVAPVTPAGSRSPRPGLLTRIDNGVGAVTEIVYETTQQLAAQFTDNDSENFRAPWLSHVPVVIPIVTRVSTRDVRSAAGGAAVEPFQLNRTTRFEYRDPAYDPWERTFKGFQRVRAIQPSGEVEQTWFWFGDCANGGFISNNCMKGSDASPDKGLMGAAVRVDRFRPGGGERPEEWLMTTTMQYQRDSVFIKSEGVRPDRNVTFSAVAQTDTYVYDTALPVSRTDEVGHPTTRQRVPTQDGATAHVRSTTEYDAAGNIKITTNHGRIAPNDKPLDTSVRKEMLPFANRCRQDWACLATGSRVVETRPTETFDTLLRSSEFVYNVNGDLEEVWSELSYPRSQPAALARNMTFGAPAPRTASTQPGRRHLRSFRFDEFGNLTSMRGHSSEGLVCSRVTFDQPYKQFPDSITTHSGTACTGVAFTTQHVFDRGLGAPLSKTYPNRTMETIEYDAFGRAKTLFAPAADGNPLATELAATIGYHTRSPLSWIEVKSRVDVDAFRTSIEIFNGLGEHVVGFDQADNVADGAPWILRGWTERDGNGLVHGVLRPWFFSGDPVALADNALPQSPSGRRLATVYDPFGRLISTFDGALPTARFTHRPLSLTMSDAEQLKTSGPYSGLESVSNIDGHGRTIETRRPAGDDVVTTRVKYLGTGEPVEIQRSGKVDPEVYLRSMQWDSFGRLIHNYEPNTVGSDPSGRRGWHYVYDDESRLVGTSDARGCGKNLSYDALGRLLAEDFSPCQPEHLAYTVPNLLTGDGTEAFYRYDTYEAGQVAPTTEFRDAVPLALGMLVSIQDRSAHTRINYDGRGRTRRISKRIARPDARPGAPNTDRYTSHWFEQELSYDLGDRIVSRTTGLEGAEFTVAGESQETMKYSARGTLREIGSSYGNLVNALTYSASGQPLHVRYGDRPQTQTAMGYDPRERLLKSRTWRQTAPALWTNPPLPGYSRPDQENTQLTLTDLEFTYDDVGNPNTINDSSSDFWRDGAKPVSRSFIYDSAYRLNRIDYQHNQDVHVPVFRAEAQAGDQRPIAELRGAHRIQTQTFAYDWQGNTQFAEDNERMRFDRSLGTIDNGIVTNGSRSVPNQLIDADGIHADYDHAGNLTDLTVARPNCSPAMPKCSHRFRYDWDEAGQLARARRWDYAPGTVPSFDSNATATWDLGYAYGSGGRGRITFIDERGVERHTLDVFNSLRVVRTTFDRASATYMLAPENQVGFMGGVAQVFYDRRQQLPQAGATPLHIFFSLGDHLGSSAFVLDRDSGEVVERTTYQAFGATEADFRPARWASFREQFKFTGKEEDIEVGAAYYGARYYNARLGRWMSADPLAIHGLAADANPYAYVSGRVTSDVDPFGLEPVPAGGTNRIDHPNGTFSVVMPDGTIEIRDIDRPAAARPAERDILGADRAGLSAQNVLRGSVHIPLNGKNYFTPNGIRKAAANYANSTLTGLVDPIGYRHIAKLAGVDIESAFQIQVGEDGNDQSEAVGAAALLLANIIAARGATSAPIHHLATNKSVVSTVRGGPWTPKFFALFKQAGMTLEDSANKVRVPGHVGPHPEVYHQMVYDRLANALLSEGGTTAFRNELAQIKWEAKTTGTYLNRLLTGR